MNFYCQLEYVLVVLKTGARFEQAFGFHNIREAQEWYERKQVEWVDTYRIVSAVITVNSGHLPFDTPPPPKSLVERYSGAGSF